IILIFPTLLHESKLSPAAFATLVRAPRILHTSNYLTPIADWCNTPKNCAIGDPDADLNRLAGAVFGRPARRLYSTIRKSSGFKATGEGLQRCLSAWGGPARSGAGIRVGESIELWERHYLRSSIFRAGSSAGRDDLGCQWPFHAHRRPFLAHQNYDGFGKSGSAGSERT